MNMMINGRKSSSKKSVPKKKFGFFAALKKSSMKKGFTLVEMLIGVAIMAILIPAMLKIFLLSSNLNKSANMRGRVDHLAESTLEEAKKVDFDKLKTWFEDNGWELIENHETDESSETIYIANKTVDQNSTLSMTVSKYFEDGNPQYKAGVPKFPGTDTKDINIGDKQTLGVEQNALAVSEMAARLNINQGLKQKIWDNAIKNQLSASHIFDSTRLTIISTNNDQAITSANLTKKTEISVTFDTARTKVTAQYKVTFLYSVNQVQFQYLYYDENNRFKTLNDSYTFSSSETIEETFSEGTIEKAFNGVDGDTQNMFISYTPLNANDIVLIDPPTTAHTDMNIIFEENQRGSGMSYVLSPASLKPNSYTGCDILDYGGTKVLKNVSTGHSALFSSNNSTMGAPLSESAYQDEVKIWMYRIEVTAEIKGSAASTKGVTATFKSSKFR